MIKDGNLLVPMILFLAVIASQAFSQEKSSSSKQEVSEQGPSKILEGAASYLLRTNPKHPLRRSKEKLDIVLDAVLQASLKNDVDPHLMLTVAFCESSLRSGVVSKSKLKEFGLMQVHGLAAKGCELSTVEGQMDCGVKWFRKGYDDCGSITGALTAYATGDCRTENPSVQNLVDYRLRLWEKLRSL